MQEDKSDMIEKTWMEKIRMMMHFLMTKSHFSK
jgi:hypothetical protein